MSDPTTTPAANPGEAVARLEQRHYMVRWVDGEACHGCRQPWPCDTITLIQALATATKERNLLEEAVGGHERFTTELIALNTALTTENAALRGALTKLEQWDMLTLTPDGKGAATGDAPWARRLIRDALATLPGAGAATPGVQGHVHRWVVPVEKADDGDEWNIPAAYSHDYYEYRALESSVGHYVEASQVYCADPDCGATPESEVR